MNNSKKHKQHELVTQLRVCVADIDVLIARTKLLCKELAEWRLLPPEERKDPAHLDNSISFKELRQFDLRCQDALQEEFPDIAKEWYVMQEMELASEDEILVHLQTKRVNLQHALSRLGVKQDSNNKDPIKEKEEDVIILKPSFFGMGIDLKAAWRKLTKRNKDNRKNDNDST